MDVASPTIKRRARWWRRRSRSPLRSDVSSNWRPAGATEPQRCSESRTPCDLTAASAVRMLRVWVEPPPAGAFLSGSQIRGCVYVETERERKFRYIHVSLTGRSQVQWCDSSTQRVYKAEREYLHETQMLWVREESPNGSLSVFPAGSHSFPFQFQLPQNLPSSFEGRVGCVCYELLGRIVTASMNVEHSVEIVVPVIEIVDISSRPRLLVPQSVQVMKRVWSFPCTLANVTMTVSLSRSAFCVGEDIPLNVGLENCSRYEVTMTAVLRQKVTYTAKKSRRQFDKATVVKVDSQRFAPRSSTIWPTNLRVPVEEATTQSYNPINIAYRIKVVASVGWGQMLVARIPITIGNIPLNESLVDKDIHNSRDHLQFGSHGNSRCSFISLDDGIPRQQSELDFQLEHTLTPSALTQESCDEGTLTTSNSCFHDYQYTYSVQEYVDSGNLSDDGDL